MILYIDGSDIRRLVVATSEETRTFDSGPEGYLAAISTMVEPEALEGIIVVQGPGSATALRASLSIANTLAMTQRIPLYGVQSGTSYASALLALPEPKPFLEPIYGAEAQITVSKKDQLRRTQ